MADITNDDDIKIVSGTVDVPLKDLHIQYVHNVTPAELWNFDMSLANSPHVELLKLIREKGFDWDEIWKTRYVAERLNRFKLGMNNWTRKHLKEHIKWRYEVLRSLKHHGYKAKLHITAKGKNRPVRILKEPFWKTRFGFERDWLTGYEIWDGGGRSSAAMALGWETIPAVICEDRYPGSKKKGMFDKKLSMVKGVWNEVIPPIPA